MHVLVINGAGFIGSSLIERLIQLKINVRVLDSAERINLLKIKSTYISTYAHNFNTLVNTDSCFDDIDAIVHLGCTTHPKSSMDDPYYDAKTNILASINLLEAAATHGIETFIFASSGGAIYGETGKQAVDESQPTTPLCAYGISKQAIENYIRMYAEQYSFRGISLRIANGYGPYQLKGTAIGTIAHFMNCIVNQKTINIWGNGSTVRDYIYVTDIVDGIIRCLQTKSMPSGSYNLGTGAGYSLNEILEQISELTGRQTNINYLTSRKFDVSNITLNSAALSKETGWRPKIKIGKGIELMWRHLK